MGRLCYPLKTNKQTTPNRAVLLANIDQNRKIGGSVALAMAELAYFFDERILLWYKKIQTAVGVRCSIGL